MGQGLIIAKYSLLSVNLDNNTGTNCMAAFTDSETEAFFNSDWCNQFDIHFNVIARHAHFSAFRQGNDTCNVCCSEIELRTIVIEERSMTAAFIFGQNINLATEFCVRMNSARLCKNLAALDFISLNTTEKNTVIIAGLC